MLNPPQRRIPKAEKPCASNADLLKKPYPLELRKRPVALLLIVLSDSSFILHETQSSTVVKSFFNTIQR
jgi:hypothetical protein